MKKPKKPVMKWVLLPDIFGVSPSSVWNIVRVDHAFGPHALNPVWQKESIFPLYDNYWEAWAECLKINAGTGKKYATSAPGSQKKGKRISRVL